MQVEGSVALVTGGSSGLGGATVVALLRQGASVVILDLPSDRAAQFAAGLGPNARLVAGDVTDPVDVQRAVDAALALGPLRITVNCAGIGDPARVLGRSGPLTLERFTRIVAVNLFGTFNVTRLAAAAMAATEPIDNERGVIVNTASVAAFDGQVGQASYAASKAAVAGMTLPLARELGESLIRVMTIAPGLFETPILSGLTDDARRSIASQVPHPARLGRPEEYARLVLHIAENAMLNGETIRLDGALRMAAR